jgi:hypothetical protein
MKHTRVVAFLLLAAGCAGDAGHMGVDDAGGLPDSGGDPDGEPVEVPDAGSPDAGSADAGVVFTGCEPGFEESPPGQGCVRQNPRLTVPARLVRGGTLTVRAEILDESAAVDRSGCFAELGSVSMASVATGAEVPITATFFDDHLPTPDDSVRFYHGVGSVSFSVDDPAALVAGEYKVVVEVRGLRATGRVTVVEPAWRVMPATLSGADLEWGPNQEIRLSAHVTEVPVGSTLVIHPGTSIRVDTTGGLEDGTLLDVRGRVEAIGTLDRPIHFFSERGAAAMTHTVAGASLSNPDAWRGINFFGDGSSKLHWVILTGAGNGVVVSHPRPPILNVHDTHSLEVEDGVFTDSTGMMFQTPGTGSYAIRRSLVSRVGIGGEFLSSGHTLVIEDTWWTGIGHGPTTPLRFDGDGIHIDGFGSDQTLRGVIVADIGDDALDHSNSVFTVEDTVIHDAGDKAVSMTGGLGTFRNVLVFNADTGIRGRAHVYGSTIATGSPIANPEIVQESIIWPASLGTCSGDIDWSMVGDVDDLGCGDGNQSVDPAFADVATCDYRPGVGSPALTAGPTGGAIGWRGY